MGRRLSRNTIEQRLNTMPDSLKSWNGVVMTEDIWLDRVMKFGSGSYPNFKKIRQIREKGSESRKI